ncbi:MAG: hypothetical protein JW772_05340 [Candidatus Diapherotrites archaeon]|nr:hypothetical protein [Candidatus Diapherotrites archaeon]
MPKRKVKRKTLAKPKPQNLRAVPEGFVTVTRAGKIMREEGVKVSDITLTKLVDKGILGSGRLAHHPQHARILSNETVQRLIANRKAGKQWGFGFQGIEFRMRGRPATKPKKMSEAQIRRIGNNFEANLRAAKSLRDKIFLDDKVSANLAIEIEQVINRGLELDPKKFSEEVLPKARAMLRRKKA